MTTREQQKMETRRRILEALVDSLVSVGYSKTSTVEVQERAGVSRGALLHHFPSRAELFEAAVAHLVEHNERALALSAAADPSPKSVHPMRRMIRVLNQAMHSPSYAAELELWAAARTDPDLRTALLKAERKAQRVLRRAVDQLMGEPWTQLPTYSATIDMTIEMLRGLATRRSLYIERAKEVALVEQWSTFAVEMLDRQT